MLIDIFLYRHSNVRWFVVCRILVFITRSPLLGDLKCCFSDSQCVIKEYMNKLIFTVLKFPTVGSLDPAWARNCSVYLIATYLLICLIPFCSCFGPHRILLQGSLQLNYELYEKKKKYCLMFVLNLLPKKYAVYQATPTWTIPYYQWLLYYSWHFKLPSVFYAEKGSSIVTVDVILISIFICFIPFHILLHLLKDHIQWGRKWYTMHLYRSSIFYLSVPFLITSHNLFGILTAMQH